MGQAAVSLLPQQIEGRPARREELLFEPEPVVRNTTGARRAALART
jgi:LacI family repressor for deo operon, udp, cdd, tsx, nupC, and nupG